MAEGTFVDPLSFPEALGTQRIKPGHTVWMRGGTYTLPDNVAHLTQPGVTWRNYPGERVRIQAQLHLVADGITLWGLERFDAPATRITDLPGSNPDPAIFPTLQGIWVDGADNVRVINCILHDMNGVGITFHGGLNLEMYGTIIYNTGWIGPDRNHGACAYGHNARQDTAKAFKNCLFLNPFYALGFELGSGSSNDVNNITVEDCALVNCRFWTGSAEGTIRNLVVRRLHTWRGRIDLGAPWQQQPVTSALLEDSTFGLDNFYVFPSLDTTIQRCTFYGARNGVYYVPNPPGRMKSIDDKYLALMNLLLLGDLGEFEPTPAFYAAYKIDHNTFYADVFRGPLYGDYYNKDDNILYTDLAQYRADTGFDLHSEWIFDHGLWGSGAQAFVVPNVYDENRAHLTVYNWDEAETVEVDVSAWARDGEAITVRNPMLFWDEMQEAVVSGGVIDVPMTGWTTPIPTGHDALLYPETGPAFGAFALTK